MSHLALVLGVVMIVWLVRRDRARRPGVSGAIWIPTLWVGIIASRPLSAWLGSGGGSDTLEGSPLDRLFFFALIFASLVVLSRRRTPWATLIPRNWPVVLFYGFLLVTVLWANSPLSSLKRWMKECGNIFVVLVILTEQDPRQAIRAVFIRCAYVLVPMSIIFIRYFPELGRRYASHSGELEVTGVTTQKNSLGGMIMVCGLIIIWDWLENSRPGAAVRTKLDKYISIALALGAAWLLHLSNSKTSLACLLLGGGILVAARVPALQRRISALGTYFFVGGIAYFVFDWAFGLSTAVVSNMGRDMTFTGRTEVWRELLGLHTDPVFGTGYMSLWDDPALRARLPEWVASSAHNGFLEIYLASGAIGLGLLALLLLNTGFRLNRALADADNYSLLRFAVFVAMVMSNFSESHFASMAPAGFLLLLVVIGEVDLVPQRSRFRALPARAPELPEAVNAANVSRI